MAIIDPNRTPIMACGHSYLVGALRSMPLSLGLETLDPTPPKTRPQDDPWPWLFQGLANCLEGPRSDLSWWSLGIWG